MKLCMHIIPYTTKFSLAKKVSPTAHSLYCDSNFANRTRYLVGRSINTQYVKKNSLKKFRQLHTLANQQKFSPVENFHVYRNVLAIWISVHM